METKERTLRGLEIDADCMNVLGKYTFVNVPKKTFIYVELTNPKNGNKLRTILYVREVYEPYETEGKKVNDAYWLEFVKQCEALDERTQR